MKTKEVLLVGVFAVSLLFLMIGVIIGSRASPPLFFGAVPPGPNSTMQMPAAGALGPAPSDQRTDARRQMTDLSFDL